VPVEDRKPYSEKHQKRMKRAQRAHRTDLKDWQKQQHAKRWKETKSRLVGEAKLSPPVIKFSDLESIEEFREKFEKPKQPCVITGMADEWPAREAWSIASLRERFGDIKLKCGEDDDGYPIKVKLETFCRYMENQKDDSPLYIFDTSYERTCPQILKEYRIPEVFPEDLFALVGEKRRPPYRWFLIGPERSGTTVHIDPLETAAWNTLLRGRKLWVMFSPELTKQQVKGKRHMRNGGDDEAIDWMSEMLPRMIKSGDLEECRTTYNFIQYPGDTIFVPNGWWHCVLNLDDTVAITQNFVSSVNFPEAWRSVRVERKKMARKWRSQLKSARPDLFELCERMDREDGYDLDGEIEKRKEEKRSKEKAKKKKKAKSDDDDDSDSSSS